jgi:hypothetical protein
MLILEVAAMDILINLFMLFGVTNLPREERGAGS